MNSLKWKNIFEENNRKKDEKEKIPKIKCPFSYTKDYFLEPTTGLNCYFINN